MKERSSGRCAEAHESGGLGNGEAPPSELEAGPDEPKCRRQRRVEGEVITGAQIRRARELLGWTRFKLSSRAGLHPAIVERAEEAAGARCPSLPTSRPYCGTLLKPPASISRSPLARARRRPPGFIRPCQPD
jgi:hypothetical protein